MTIKYGTIVTAIGLVKLTNAALLNEPLTLEKVKFGDSGGTEYTPDQSCTDLKNVVHESNLIAYKKNEGGAHWVTIESSIAYKFGPFWVRELGIYDTDGDLIFIEAVAPRFKPDSNGDSSVDMSFSTTVDIINNDSVDFIIDPHVAIATVKYVDDLAGTKVDKSSITHSTVEKSKTMIPSAFALNTVWDRAVAAHTIAKSKWQYVTATISRYGAVLLSNSYTGNSQTKAVTEKALSDGLATKSSGSHSHDNDYYLKHHLDGLLAGKLGTNNKAVAAGTADVAVRLSRGRTNYVNFMDDAVVGQLGWANFGNNHTIFDASRGEAPGGKAINRSDPVSPWTATYPTLMGWNGVNTYGVRVDSARYAEHLGGKTKGAVIAEALAGKCADTALFDGHPSTDFRQIAEGGLRTVPLGQIAHSNGSYNTLIARMATNTSQWSAQGPLIVEVYNKYYNTGGYKKYIVQFGYRSPVATVNLIEAAGDIGKERLFAEPPVLISGTTRYVDIKLNTADHTQAVVVIKTCAGYNSDKNNMSANQIYYPIGGAFERVSAPFTRDTETIQFMGRDINVGRHVLEQNVRVYSPGNKPTPADLGALAVGGKAADSARLNGNAPSISETGDTAALRTSAGDINARLFKSTFPTQTSMHSDVGICFRNDEGTGNADNYMRFVNRSGFQRWLGAQNKIKYGTGIPTSSGAQEGDIYIRYNL